MDERVRTIIENPDLLWRGHFAAASGKHTEVYWTKFRILEQPNLLATLCEPIVQRFQDIDIDIVVGPTLGGVLVAYEVARQMGKKVVSAVRAANSDSRTFRQPSILSPSHRVLIVDDILMSGWTLERVTRAVCDIGAQICGIAVILDRSMITPRYEYPLFVVHHMEMPDYDPEDCPLCKQGIPLTKAAGTT